MPLQGEVESGHTPPEEAERELVARAIAGDEVAFTRLYDMHYDRVLRHIYYRVGRVEDAEDLTQKVFLQAWRALGRYRYTGTPFVAWLVTIAHNATISFVRSRKATNPLLYDPSDRDVAIDPDGALEERAEQERVRRAIARLTSDQQQVVTMRFLEGFEYGEIASALGKSQGNVRVIQHRALEKLRQLLARDESLAKAR